MPHARTPRVLATDLDGTLLRSDGTVSPRSRSALADAEAAGIHVVFVTARPPRWLRGLRGVVGAHGQVLASNGAFVVDVAQDLVLREEGFGRQGLAELVAALRAGFPGAGLAVERRDGLTRERAYPQAAGDDPARVVDDLLALDDLDEQLTAKLLLVQHGRGGEAFLGEVADVVGDRGHVAYSGAGFLAEISAPGVTKAAALARWCLERGIEPSEVWAFGDMPNDLPMLTWAGLPVAVANAHPHVRSAASRVCPGNDEDGVAQVVEALLANGTWPDH